VLQVALANSPSEMTSSPQAAAVVVQVDLHLDTPTQLLEKQLGLDAVTGLESGLAQMRAGGTNASVMVLWPPRQSEHKARTFALLQTMEREIARLDSVELVRSPAELRAVTAAGRLAVMFSVEGAHGLGTEQWRPVLDELHARGLSLMGLTWSMSNRFAGSSGDGGGGLTAEGRALVGEMRRRGIGVDVSHASRATSREVCEGSPVPVIASHSDAHALTPQARNLTDDEIRCIAGTGGVIGLNFHAPFVGPNADVARVADHADHLAQVGGPGVVSLGSDFDGYIKKPVGLEHAGKIGALWDELRGRGWTEGQIRGVQGENFLRAWDAILAGAHPESD
jgi:membrane dipeptidase